MNHKINWDGLGVTTSLICAIHCAVLPLLFTSLPLFGGDIIHNDYFEWSMIALAFMIGVYSLSNGFLKQHSQFFPLVIFCLGFSLLLAKEIFIEFELIFLFPAIALIIAAHFFNYRLCKKSRCTVPGHQQHLH